MPISITLFLSLCYTAITNLDSNFLFFFFFSFFQNQIKVLYKLGPES